METIKLMHPMWAYGEWLDLHAAEVGLKMCIRDRRKRGKGSEG